MKRKTYTAQVVREGKWWVADILDTDWAAQSRRLDGLEGVVREVLSLALEADAGSFGVVLEYVPDHEVAELMAREDALRAESARLKSEAAAANREVAALLRRRGYTLRDIGSLMGVSYQRASQLVASHD